MSDKLQFVVIFDKLKLVGQGQMPRSFTAAVGQHGWRLDGRRLRVLKVWGRREQMFWGPVEQGFEIRWEAGES